MRLRDESNRLLIRHSPRRYWLAGGLILILGALFFTAAIGLLGDLQAPRSFGIKMAAVAVIIGGIGAWLCWHAPRLSVVVDRATRLLTVTRRGWLHSNGETYPGPMIGNVRVTKERDGKGKPVYRVELLLQTGAVVAVPLARPHDRKRCMRAAERIGDALSLPRPGADVTGSPLARPSRDPSQQGERE